MTNLVTRSIAQRLSSAPVRRSAAQRRLAADLDAFTSQADLQELAAMLDRHADSDTDAIRNAVDWTRAA